MVELPEDQGRERQAEHWEKFYQDHDRPWRGMGKIDFDLEPGSKVLDVGCGTGKTTATLIKMGMDVTGLDFSPSAISHCIEMFGEKAKFTLAECDRMPFPENSFDAVVAVHVFEHLDEEQLEGTIKEISRVLIPGGVVFVRCFAVGDSRSKGKDSDTRGNGIEYRYYTEEQMKNIFEGFDTIMIERKDETMKFGAVRVKMECLFSLPR
jgi:ubiquinone/menaquinone biosynthesis C-methylase UbiE